MAKSVLLNRGDCMKRILALVLIFAMVSGGINVFAEGMYTENPDTSDWIIWENPTYSKRSGTATDASFLLDAPAGKHGFIHASGEDMYFEDGTRARFWGINVGREAVFGTCEEANALAERIAQSGYNLVRLHQMDYNTYDCIFGESGAVSIDKKQLNKLFYFISCLKERGIYIYTDLLVRRNLEAAFENNYGAVGTAVFFDDKLIELQKEYARTLLTTVNPFTGLALKDDPALVFVQLVNEFGAFDIAANSMSVYYISEMNVLFNEYLSQRYNSDSELCKAWENADGSSGVNAGESIIAKSITFFNDGSKTLSELMNEFNEQKRADVYGFLYEVMEKYYAEMRDYLREIGIQAMITGVGMGGGKSDAVPANVRLNKEYFDFTDRHTYMAHPINGWAMTEGLKFWGPSMLYKPEIFKSVPASKPYNQPYVLGEWEECNTSEYRAEAMPMMAGYACFQNYTPIHFCLISGRERDNKNGYIDSPFSVYNDPVQTAAAPISAMVYLRHEVDEAESAHYSVTNKRTIIEKQSKFNDYDDSFRYLKRGVIYDDLSDFTEDAINETVYKNLYVSGMSSLNSKINNQMSYSSFDKNENWQNWNAKDFHMFSINSDYTNLVTGFEKGKSYEFGDAYITYNNDFAMVGLTSVTTDKISESNRLLVTAVGRARSKGYEVDYGSSTIKSGGHAPVLAEPIDAEIILKTNKNIKVYALDSSGRRKEKVAVTDTDKGKKVHIGKEYKALFYEIVKEDSFTGIGVSADFESGIEAHGFAKNFADKSVNVSVVKNGKEYFSVDTKADLYGNIDVNIPITTEIPDGIYEIDARSGSDRISSSFVYADYDRPSIIANTSVSGKKLTVYGKVTLDGNAVENANVTVRITKPSGTESDADISAKDIFDLKSVMTDETGNYTAEFSFSNCESGYYGVSVIATVRNGEKMYRSYPTSTGFEYNSEETYLEIQNAEDKSAVYMVRPGESITGIVRCNEELSGCILLAVYHKDMLVSASIGNNKTVSAKIPEIAGDLSVKILFIKSLADITPLASSAYIKE